MYPLPSPSTENEPGAPIAPFEDYGPSASFLTWIVAAGLGVYIFKKFLDGDLFHLQALHYTTRMLQSTARTVGELALIAEQSYNDHVNILH